ncbi:hypothetical protein cypCar_00025878 [Cyprinus carpio]|nr:hypothetical protein cypCar_00025878 [Cyprinus carpio]
MASQGDGEVWYALPVYTGYWQHYQQAMSWHQRHKRAYRKALEVGYFQALYSMYPSAIQRYSGWHADESCRNGHRDRTTGREEERENEATDSDSETEEESSDESQIECDISNMDISEELRQYFAQTERHRQELQRPGERRTPEMKKLYGKDAAKIQGMEAAMQLTFDCSCDKKQPKYWPVIPLNP